MTFQEQLGSSFQPLSMFAEQESMYRAASPPQVCGSQLALRSPGDGQMLYQGVVSPVTSEDRKKQAWARRMLGWEAVSPKGSADAHEEP